MNDAEVRAIQEQIRQEIEEWVEKNSIVTIMRKESMTDEAQAPEEETQGDAGSGAEEEAPAEETNVDDEVNEPQETEEG